MSISGKEILDKMKATAQNVASGAADVASNVVKGAEDMVEQNKAKAALSAEKKKIEKLFREIGEKVYQTAGDTVDRSVVAEQIRAVDESYEKIKELMAKASALRKVQICPACGRECSLESAFCAVCGAALDKASDGEEKKS